MQKNRLIELKRYSKKPSQIGSKLKQPLVTQASQSTSNTIEDDYSYCKELIQKLNNQVFDMNEMKKHYARSTKSVQQKQIMSKVNQVVKKGNMLINDLQKNVLKINDEFNKQKQQKGDTSNAIMCADITRKANNTIKQYKEAQEKFGQTVRQTIKRQATIIKRQQLTQEQVDELVHNPQSTQNMLKQKLLNAPSAQLQNAVSDIIDKCRDIVRLEKNVHECVQMIKELALLTQIQAEQINNIQVAIDSARDYVAQGQTKLVGAKTYYKKSQKKMCCIMMIVFVILGVIIVPVLITKV